MKICKKCNIEKEIICFRVYNGYIRGKCKDCEKQYYYDNKELCKRTKDEYRIKNREKLRQNAIKYREKNKNEIKKKWEKNKHKYKDSKKEYQKKYRIKNKERDKEYRKLYRIKNRDTLKNKIKNTPLLKLKLNIRGNILITLKRNGYKKKSKTHDILGCSFEEFKIYLESKFEPWMNWENRGLYNGELNYGWDLDHIIPASSAKNEEELIKLNHYSNFQPLDSKINRDIKKDSLNEMWIQKL